MTALRHTETDILAPLTSHLPADQDLFTWLAFGELVATWYYELAGEGLSFATVASRGQSLARRPARIAIRLFFIQCGIVQRITV